MIINTPTPIFISGTKPSNKAAKSLKTVILQFEEDNEEIEIRVSAHSIENNKGFGGLGGDERRKLFKKQVYSGEFLRPSIK